MNLGGFGYQATMLICRFAGFDLKWMRLSESTRRKVQLHKALLTAYSCYYIDRHHFSDRLRRFPLTYLAGRRVNNRLLSSVLSADSLSTGIQPTLLDVVISHLVKPLCPHDDPVSDYASQMCGITQLQANDYVLEQSWRKYSWQGFEWLYNFVTEEEFWKDDPGPWRAYRYKHAVWWLNGKRWFWEVNGLPDVATTP